MTYLIKKLKLVATGILALAFFMTVSLSSCGTKSDSSDDSEAVEEHPAANDQAMDSTKEEEHPAGEGEGEEHPSDSTKTTED